MRIIKKTESGLCYTESAYDLRQDADKFSPIELYTDCYIGNEETGKVWMGETHIIKRRKHSYSVFFICPVASLIVTKADVPIQEQFIESLKEFQVLLQKQGIYEEKYKIFYDLVQRHKTILETLKTITPID